MPRRSTPTPGYRQHLRTQALTWGLDVKHFGGPRPGDALFRPYSFGVREGARPVGDFVLNGSDVAEADGGARRARRAIRN